MWFWFIAGLALGWLIEWIIDWSFWRRDVMTSAEHSEALQKHLDAAHQTIRAQEARIQELESLLAAHPPQPSNSVQPTSGQRTGQTTQE